MDLGRDGVGAGYDGYVERMHFTSIKTRTIIENRDRGQIDHERWCLGMAVVRTMERYDVESERRRGFRGGCPCELEHLPLVNCHDPSIHHGRQQCQHQVTVIPKVARRRRDDPPNQKNQRVATSSADLRQFRVPSRSSSTSSLSSPIPHASSLVAPPRIGSSMPCTYS